MQPKEKTMQKIGINNADFLVSQLCADAPRHMWVRELLRNAIESTENYLKNNPSISVPVEIKVRALSVKGLIEGVDFTKPKISILNLGGMTYSELIKAMDMASSIDKTQGENENFGIGAKVTISRWSNVLFVTRKRGRASACLIGFDNGRLVRLLDVKDLTAWVEFYSLERGYPKSDDFTEVILMGKASQATQNTLTHPYYDEDQKSRTFMLTTAFQRFANLPQNIIIRFETGTGVDDTPHSAIKGYPNGLKFRTWNQCWNDSIAESSIHTVVEKEGFKFHFYYDPPKSLDNDSPTSEGSTANICSTTFSAFVYGKSGQEEYYGNLTGQSWKTVASRLGILNGHKYLRIFIEMPFQDYKNNKYREHLVQRDDYENRIIDFASFVPVLKELLPVEIKAKIAEHNTGAQASDIDEMLKEAYQEYKLHMNLPVASGVGTGAGTSSKGTIGSPKTSTKNSRKNNKPNIPSISKKWTSNNGNNSSLDPDYPVFKIVDGATAEVQEMQQYFAKFVPDGDESGRDLVLINNDHPVIEVLTNRVKYDPTVEDRVRDWASKLLQVKIGVSIMLAKGALDNEDSGVTRQEFESLTKPGVLTLQAQQNNDLLDKLKHKAKDEEKMFDLAI